MTKWHTTDYEQYIEVMPVTDSKEHLAGDECWCNPIVERNPNARPMISHNEVTDLQPSDAQSDTEDF